LSYLSCQWLLNVNKAKKTITIAWTTTVFGQFFFYSWLISHKLQSILSQDLLTVKELNKKHRGISKMRHENESSFKKSTVKDESVANFIYLTVPIKSCHIFVRLSLSTFLTFKFLMLLWFPTHIVVTILHIVFKKLIGGNSMRDNAFISCRL
jgi:hypothetical protein